MPLGCCHPVAAHEKLRIPDTYVSSLMLDRALDAIARRVGAIDRDHDRRHHSLKAARTSTREAAVVPAT